MPLFLLHNQVHGRPMFCSFGKALKPSCLTFLSESAIDEGIPKRLNLERSYALVIDTRKISKQSMKSIMQGQTYKLILKLMRFYTW